MYIRSALCFMAAYFVLGIIGLISPAYTTSQAYGFVCLLFPPLFAGFIVRWKYDFDISKMDRWVFSALMSGALCLLIGLLLNYAASTEAGAAVIQKALEESDRSFVSLMSIILGIMFFVYLFGNRICFGVGNRLGDFFE